MRKKGGRRYYRPGDIEFLKGIKDLLHEKNFTIKRVKEEIGDVVDELKEAVDQAKDIKDAAKGKPRRGRKPKAGK